MKFKGDNWLENGFFQILAAPGSAGVSLLPRPELLRNATDEKN
jgi:hypothetical protein